MVPLATHAELIHRQ